MRLVGKKRSLQARGCPWLSGLVREAQTKEIYEGKKMHAKYLLQEAAAARSLGKGRPNETPHKERLVLSQESKTFGRHDGAESDQGGAGGRLVGADEK